MREMIAAALAFGVAAPTAAADAPANEVADLRAFADAFDAAQIAQDRAALDRMVADDLVFIDGSGKRYGKAFSSTAGPAPTTITTPSRSAIG